MDLKFYFLIFMRRIHWFLLFVVVGAAVGITLAQVLPTKYVARAQLLVESEQIPGDLAASTVQTEATEQLQIIQQRIQTRNVLIDMANRLGIYAEQSLTTDEIVEDLRQRIQIVTTGGASARARDPAQATLVAISFEAEDPQMAAKVANEVVTQILREDIEIRTRVARQTLDFFEQELLRLDQELAKRGQVILEFKEKNQNSLPDSLEFRRSQQVTFQERLLQLERDETVINEQRERSIKLHESVNDVTSPLIAERDKTTEQRNLDALNEERATLLAVLAPSNPRINILEVQIEALEKIVAAQTPSEAMSDATGVPLTAFEIQISEFDSQLAFIDQQKTEIRASLKNLLDLLGATPTNSITLDTLERDYANIRSQYDQAVANKARAETGDMIETLSKGQRISVIEQAVAPRLPEQPNRPVLVVGGIGGGVALGLAMIVLLEILDAGIRRPADLTSRLGITPIATLPYLQTRQEIWARRVKISMILCIFLLGVPALLLAVHFYFMPLGELMDMVLRRGQSAALMSPSTHEVV